MFEFYKYFRTNILLNAISGLPSPGLPSALSKYNIILTIHFVISVLCHVYTVVLCSAVIIKFRPTADVAFMVTRICMDCEVIFHMIYYLYNHRRIVGIIRKIDYLIAAFQSDPLTRKKDFTGFIDYRYVKLKYYIQGIFVVCSSLPTIHAILKFIRYFGLFGTDGKARVLYEVPYKLDHSPAFGATIFIQLYDVTFCCLKHIANEAFLLSMFALQTALYRYLRETFAIVFSPDDSTDFHSDENAWQKTRLAPNKQYTLNNIKMKTWIRFHQQALSIGNDIVRLYAPILLVYFCLIYVIITSMIFSLTVNKNTYETGELTAITTYWCIMLLNLFILCICGTNMVDEGTNVAQLGFASTWYNCSPQVKNSAKIIFERVRLALKPSALGLFNYDLSNESFVTILKSMVSFYITLVQITQMQQQQEQQ